MTGGHKHDHGKPRFDLIPPRPLEEVARVFTVGAEKYGDRNWEQGLAYGRVFAAMQRHAWAGVRVSSVEHRPPGSWRRGMEVST